jgi:hypothetical protein
MQPPLAIRVHQERNVLGVIVLVACHNVEYHAAVKLKLFFFREFELAHDHECLLIAVCAGYDAVDPYPSRQAQVKYFL